MTRDGGDVTRATHKWSLRHRKYSSFVPDGGYMMFILLLTVYITLYTPLHIFKNFRQTAILFIIFEHPCLLVAIYLFRIKPVTKYSTFS